MDGLDHRLHLLVAEHDRAEHHVFGQLVRFRFDHQHRGFRTGDDEVELRARELRLARIQHVRAVDVADPRRADRAVERDAGQRDRRRRADERGNVRIGLRIDRHDRRDDLDIVVEAVREQRPQRPVDEARRQRLLLRRAPLALEEAAGDLACGVGLFLVIDGQRKEILAGLRRTRRDAGDQHDGIAQARHDGAACLAGYFTGFQRQRVTAERNRLLDGFQHNCPRCSESEQK